jgi:hypothetical protein
MNHDENGKPIRITHEGEDYLFGVLDIKPPYRTVNLQFTTTSEGFTFSDKRPDLRVFVRPGCSRDDLVEALNRIQEWLMERQEWFPTIEQIKAADEQAQRVRTQHSKKTAVRLLRHLADGIERGLFEEEAAEVLGVGISVGDKDDLEKWLSKGDPQPTSARPDAANAR